MFLKHRIYYENTIKLKIINWHDTSLNIRYSYFLFISLPFSCSTLNIILISDENSFINLLVKYKLIMMADPIKKKQTVREKFVYKYNIKYVSCVIWSTSVYNNVENKRNLGYLILHNIRLIISKCVPQNVLNKFKMFVI